MIRAQHRPRTTALAGRPRPLGPLALLGAFLVAPALPAAPAEAEALFARHCVSCHGKDGRAQNPAGRKLGVKDLTQSKASDADIEKQLREGSKDPRGLPRMPAFKDKLSADEIKALIVFVKGLRK